MKRLSRQTNAHLMCGCIYISWRNFRGIATTPQINVDDSDTKMKNPKCAYGRRSPIQHRRGKPVRGNTTTTNDIKWKSKWKLPHNGDASHRNASEEMAEAKTKRSWIVPKHMSKHVNMNCISCRIISHVPYKYKHSFFFFFLKPRWYLMWEGMVWSRGSSIKFYVLMAAMPHKPHHHH